MRLAFLLIITILIVSPLLRSADAAASPLTGGTINPQSPKVDLGRDIPLTVRPLGGTAPYTYRWFEMKPEGVPSKVGTNSSSYTFETNSSTTAGNYTFKVQINDSVGQTKYSADDVVTVQSALVPGAPTPPNLVVDSGRPINLTSNASGGTGSYTYQWYSGSSTACSFDTEKLGTSLNQSAFPTSSTLYCYSVTDNSHNASVLYSPTVLVTVNAVVTKTVTTTYTSTWFTESTATYSVPGLGDLQELLYVLLALVVVILAFAGIATILLLRRRPTRSDGEEFEVIGES